MEPRPPRRKKHCNGSPGAPYPIIQTISGPYKFTGRFNGVSVVIEKQSEMEKISSMGSFGKGSLSRNFPTFNKKQLPIIRHRQFDSRKVLLDKYEDTFKEFEIKSVIVVNDNNENDDIEDYLKNIQPVLRKQRVPFVETLNLLLEEAYFLLDVKECLKIEDLHGNFLDCEMAWTLFSSTQNTFIQNYVVYKFFRTRNWIVKPGLKFGGEYLLYKDGPAYYHASFLVIIDVVKSETQERFTDICKRSMDWTSLICLNRLTETAAKELLIGQVVWPQNLTLEDAKKSKKYLNDFTVNPILMRRWIPKAERKNYMGASKKSAKVKGGKLDENEIDKPGISNITESIKEINEIDSSEKKESKQHNTNKKSSVETEYINRKTNEITDNVPVKDMFKYTDCTKSKNIEPNINSLPELVERENISISLEAVGLNIKEQGESMKKDEIKLEKEDKTEHKHRKRKEFTDTTTSNKIMKI